MRAAAIFIGPGGIGRLQIRWRLRHLLRSASREACPSFQSYSLASKTSLKKRVSVFEGA